MRGNGHPFALCADSAICRCSGGWLSYLPLQGLLLLGAAICRCIRCCGPVLGRRRGAGWDTAEMAQERRGAGLLDDAALELSAVVANCAMNRERQLAGVNSYTRELGFNPL